VSAFGVRRSAVRRYAHTPTRRYAHTPIRPHADTRIRPHADTFLPRQYNQLFQVRFLPDIKRNPVPAGNVAAAGQDQQLNFWIAALEI
jgi:hypothetical protein